MNEDELARDLAKALSLRRPAPTHDLERRLLRAATRPSPVRRSFVPFLLASAVAVLVIVMGAIGLSRPPARPLPARPSAPPSHATAHDHRYADDQCIKCHGPTRAGPPPIHDRSGKLPLGDADETVPCADCHTGRGSVGTWKPRGP